MTLLELTCPLALQSAQDTVGTYSYWLNLILSTIMTQLKSQYLGAFHQEFLQINLFKLIRGFQSMLFRNATASTSISASQSGKKTV